MQVVSLHSWNVSPQRAIEIQLLLQKRISLKRFSKRIRLIAGCDASFHNGRAIGVVVVMRYPQLEVVEIVKKGRQITFPYIPGLLTFREGPVLLDCFRALNHEPDVIIFDGQGIAHFRRMGLATHLGILLSRPTIGCAKSRLTGRVESVGVKKGYYGFVRNQQNDIIGVSLRTRNNVKPVFVSPGNRITLDDSIRIILKCTKGFRIPEPLRHAHRITQEIKKQV